MGVDRTLGRTVSLPPRRLEHDLLTKANLVHSAGDGYTFPINLDNLRKLEEISKEIWAEVEVQEREHSSYGERGSGRWETGLMREGTLPGEGDSDRLSVDEDDRPLRRA